jgi:hypothetical protein
MAEVKQLDRELDEVERAISQLKRDFEMYFCGVSRQPPNDSRTKLEKIIRQYSQNTSYSFAQRFRFSNLAARFNTYQDLWSKQLKAREEGRFSAGNSPIPPSKEAPVTTKRFRKTENKTEKLFNQYAQFREKNGEPPPNMNMNKFSELIASQRDSLIKKYHCKDVEFYISVEEGKTKLKAKPLK